MTDRCQPPPHRRKTPSFSSSLLDSILQSIDETNDGALQHDHDLMDFASDPKRSNKLHLPQTRLINEEEQMASVRRAIMIDQWMETRKQNNRNGYLSPKRSSKFSSDSSTTTFTTSSASSETETPSTYRSFTISPKTADATFLDDNRKATSTKLEGKFMKLTKLRAMKIYGDLKKPISPGNRISTFIYSLFASSKKAKIEEHMQNFRKSRSIKHDTTRSCMSKKQHSSNVKRSVRFYPVISTVNFDQKSINEQRDSNSRRWSAEKSSTKNYKNFMVDMEEDDDDDDDLFELKIVGGGYGQELPVFETTDLRELGSN